jgi:hypothetical protein
VNEPPGGSALGWRYLRAGHPHRLPFVAWVAIVHLAERLGDGICDEPARRAVLRATGLREGGRPLHRDRRPASPFGATTGLPAAQPHPPRGTDLAAHGYDGRALVCHSLAEIG